VLESEDDVVQRGDKIRVSRETRLYLGKDQGGKTGEQETGNRKREMTDRTYARVPVLKPAAARCEDLGILVLDSRPRSTF